MVPKLTLILNYIKQKQQKNRTKQNKKWVTAAVLTVPVPGMTDFWKTDIRGGRRPVVAPGLHEAWTLGYHLSDKLPDAECLCVARKSH